MGRRNRVGRGPIPQVDPRTGTLVHKGQQTPGGGAGATPRASPPPPSPAGQPSALVEVAPWFVISIACYMAFLYLPGRISSPRSRLTLVGGNDFVNVASHLHFCIWIWPVHDFVFRILGILLFPPKRAAVYFTSMFLSSDGSDGGSLGMLLRMIRSLLVQPAPGNLDLIDNSTYKPHDPSTHGGVDRDSTYWHYRQVAGVSYVAMVLIVAACTYWYHTRFVLFPDLDPESYDAKRVKQQEMSREKKIAERKRDSKAKRETRAKLLERIRATNEGKEMTEEEMVSFAEQYEAETMNLAEDEFSDEEVDYDPYGRPVPGAAYVPLVTWMVGWSLVFSGAFVWVGGLPILSGQLFPIGCVAVLGFCVMMPQ